MVTFFAHILVASELYTLVEKGGLIKEGKIPMQEHDSQREEGLIFEGS